MTKHLNSIETDNMIVNIMLLGLTTFTLHFLQAAVKCAVLCESFRQLRNLYLKSWPVTSYFLKE